MQKYFIDKENFFNNIIILNNENHYHLTKVLRAKINDEIICVFNEEFYLTRISAINKNEVKLEVLKKLIYNNELPINVTVAQSLIKKDNFDTMLRNYTQFGAQRIIPITTTRTIIKTEKNLDKKIDRWRKILINSAEQSFRNKIPKLESVIKLEEINFAKYDNIYIANEKIKNEKNNFLDEIKLNTNILLIIGPEGGFDDDELNFLKNKGVKSISLGKRILKSENAGTYFLSILSYKFE